MMALFAVIFTSQSYAISGSISGPEMIHKAKNEILTMDDILKLYKSSDGQIIIVDDEFTGHGNQNGVYSITFSLYEYPSVYKLTEVHVVDDLGEATLVANQNEIYVANDVKLNPSKIIDILQKTNYVQFNSTAAVSILNNSYTGNEENNGSYIFDFRIVTTSGTNTIYESIIRVHEPNNIFTGDFIITGPPSIQDEFISFFVNYIIPIGVLGLIGFVVYKIVSKNKSKVKPWL